MPDQHEQLPIVQAEPEHRPSNGAAHVAAERPFGWSTPRPWVASRVSASGRSAGWTSAASAEPVLIGRAVRWRLAEVQAWVIARARRDRGGAGRRRRSEGRGACSVAE